MLCSNDSFCSRRYQCISGYCVYSNESYFNQHDNLDYNHALILPIIGAILHDLPSLRYVYFCIVLGLILIGLINNLFSLMTFIHERIRFTICGVYLIIYSICSLILMILISTNLITVFYYNNYFFRLWACHYYPYFSLIMVYTSILISAGIAIEGVLHNCFNFDKFRPRRRAVIVSLLIIILVSVSNLDKILARHLITSKSGDFYCLSEKTSYKDLSIILLNIYIIISCLIHFICFILILSIRTKYNFCRKLLHYQINLIPSLFIILCLSIYVLYCDLLQHYLTNLSIYQIRLLIGFIFLLYAPQIFTYMIYVLPNDFYVTEFYQIWFYRKLCCCFYNKRRHIQKFEVIHKLWKRRSSLETVVTITNLDDLCVESEFYQKK